MEDVEEEVRRKDPSRLNELEEDSGVLCDKKLLARVKGKMY